MTLVDVYVGGLILEIRQGICQFKVVICQLTNVVMGSVLGNSSIQGSHNRYLYSHLDFMHFYVIAYDIHGI